MNNRYPAFLPSSDILIRMNLSIISKLTKKGFLFTIFLCFAFHGYAGASDVAENHNSNKIAVSSTGDVYSLVAEQAKLTDVLLELGKAAGFTFKAFEPLCIEQKSWNYASMPLIQLLNNLLRDYSTVMLYEEMQEKVSENKNRKLKELWLLTIKDNAGVEDQSIYNIEIQLEQADAVQNKSPGKLPALISEQQFEIAYIDNLEGLTSDDVIETLKLTLMTNKDPLVRQRAVAALSDIGGNRVLDALESGLGDSSAAVRVELAKSFAGISNQRSILALGQMLMGDKNTKVRKQALHALSTHDSPAAHAFAEAALNDKDDSVKETARKLLY